MSESNASVSSPIPSKRRLAPTRTQLATLAAIALAVLGAFLPWVSAAGTSATGVGLGGPGVTIIVCALVSAVLILAAVRMKAAHVVSIVASLLATFVAAGNLSSVDESGFVASGIASIEPGLYLAVAGTLIWLVMGLVLFGQRLARRRVPPA